jgi:hypothetical protein
LEPRHGTLGVEPGRQVRLLPAELGVLREAQRLVALGDELVAAVCKRKNFIIVAEAEDLGVSDGKAARSLV